MPHERGSMPVLPSEFSNPTLADPKSRFCRSPAPNAVRHRIPPNLLDAEVLQSCETRRSSAWPYLKPAGFVVAC
jgi:hypothetical protein